jgi:hypothetical protein
MGAEHGARAAATNQPFEIVPNKAALLREIVGNPFRPHAIEWEAMGGDVLAIAAKAYGGGECGRCGGSAMGFFMEECAHCVDGRTPFDPDALPVLADALEEAGCTDETILRHLRGEDRCGNCNGTGGSVALGFPCVHCAGTGWRPLTVPHVRGCWALDLILNKS